MIFCSNNFLNSDQEHDIDKKVNPWLEQSSKIIKYGYPTNALFGLKKYYEKISNGYLSRKGDWKEARGYNIKRI